MAFSPPSSHQLTAQTLSKKKLTAQTASRISSFGICILMTDDTKQLPVFSSVSWPGYNVQDSELCCGAICFQSSTVIGKMDRADDDDDRREGCRACLWLTAATSCCFANVQSVRIASAACSTGHPSNVPNYASNHILVALYSAH